MCGNRLPWICLSSLMAIGIAATAAGQQGQQDDGSAHGVSHTLAALVDAFNDHDAKAMAHHWTQDALHIASSSGARSEGRDAITAAYVQLFANDPQCKLALRATSVRNLAPTVVMVDGIADVQHTNGDVTRSEISATLVKDQDTWRIDRVQELDVPLPLRGHGGLNELAGILGRWVDESAADRVQNDIYWTDNLNFIVRDYHHQRPDSGIFAEGTQIIGWDSEQGCLRSWIFDATGAFGEGTWEPVGKLPAGHRKWINKVAMKLADGRRASYTQIIEQLPDHQLAFQLIDAEVDGESQPTSTRVVLKSIDPVPDAAGSPRPKEALR